MKKDSALALKNPVAIDDMPTAATSSLAGTSPSPDVSDARLEVIATDIETLQTKAVRQVSERLAEARAIFRYRRDEGGFTGWVERRLKLSQSTVYNLLSVHDRLGSECFQLLETLPARALYAIAAPSCPDEARSEIIERAQAGETLPVAEVKEIISAAQDKLEDAVTAVRAAEEATGEIPQLEKRTGRGGKRRGSPPPQRGHSKQTGSALFKPPKLARNGAVETKPATHIELLADWRRAPSDERRKFLDNAGAKEVLAASPPDWNIQRQRPATEAGERILEILRRIETTLRNVPRIAVAAESAAQKVLPDVWAFAGELKRYALREVVVEARRVEEPGEAETGIPDILRRQTVH